MNISLWIARRMRLGNAGEGGASRTGVVIAIAGVALAVVIMELTLGIVRGFKDAITERVMGFDGQMSVLPDYSYDTGNSAAYITAAPALMDVIAEELPDAGASLRINQPGILKTDNDFAAMYFVGHDASHDAAFERSAITEGAYPDSLNRIAVSATTARALGLGVGDKVYACFFVDNAIRSRRFTISGIYDTGFGEYDRTIVFAPLASLQSVAALDSVSGTSIDITGIAPDDIERAAEKLQMRLLADYQSDRIDKLYPVDNVRHTGAVYFQWLDLLDTNVVVIFILMLCVAAFTLISSMFILILERIPTIGVLRALGASKSMVRDVFVSLTMRIVGRGLLIGNIVGIGLLLLQQHTGLLRLDPDMYYLRAVPITINWLWLILLNVGVVFAAYLILILPARLASSVSPASSIRYE